MIMPSRLVPLFALIATALVNYWFILRSLGVSIWSKARTRRRAKRLSRSAARFGSLFDELRETRDSAVRRIVVNEMIKALEAHRVEQRVHMGSTGRSNKDQTTALVGLLRKRLR